MPKSRLQLSESLCFLMLDALYLYISIGHGVDVDGRLSWRCPWLYALIGNQQSSNAAHQDEDTLLLNLLVW